ncbi:MAG: hypothetical protein EZS28_052206, partial [Streblomastix strix]
DKYGVDVVFKGKQFVICGLTKYEICENIDVNDADGNPIAEKVTLLSVVVAPVDLKQGEVCTETGGTSLIEATTNVTESNVILAIMRLLTVAVAFFSTINIGDQQRSSSIVDLKLPFKEGLSGGGYTATNVSSVYASPTSSSPIKSFSPSTQAISN